jgi:rhodanese-related sulfurtransferase
MIRKAILVLSGIILFATLAACKSTNVPKEIDVQEAAELRDQGVFILDVREPDEWTEVHIPGATLIPLGELEDRLNEVPKDERVVVVCRSGNRSKPATDILRKNGYQASSMAGGMKDWVIQGLPTVEGE